MGHELRITPGVVLKSVDQEEDAKNGFRTTYIYIGTRVECEQQRVAERIRGAKQIKLAPSGDGNWELTAVYPTDSENGDGAGEEPTDTHELDVSMAQQDVFTNPKFIADVTEDKRHIIKDFVERFKRGEFPSVAEAVDAVDLALAGDDDAYAYFELIALKGVDHWIFYRMVYSRTLTLATARQVQASFEGTQKLWTTAQLISWENLPNDWWFTLPTTMMWHKSVPKVGTNIGRSRKTQIQYQYIGSDEASTLLYDSY